MIGLGDIICGGIVPGIAAALTLSIVWRATGKAASAWRTALVVGYVAGHWALDAQNTSVVSAPLRSFRPAEARDWLPLLALLAMLPDALACVSKLGPAFGWLLRSALSIFVAWRLLHGSVHLPIPLEGLEIDLGGWSAGEAAVRIGAIGSALLLAWSISRSGSQDDNIVRSALSVLVALGAAMTMAMSASLVYGQLFGVVTAALAGCSLASAIARTGRGPEVAAGPISVIFGCLLIMGYFYAELKLHHAVMLVLSMTFAIGWLPRLERLPTWQLIGRSLLCLLTLTVVVTLAGRDFAAAIATDESDPYENFQP